MKRSMIVLFVAVWFLLMGTQAFAAVISIYDPVYSSLIVDTEANQQWLPLSVFHAKSYSYVFDHMPGGFSFARIDQITTLWNHVGITNIGSSTANNVANVQYFTDLMGPTTMSGGFPATFGLTQERAVASTWFWSSNPYLGIPQVGFADFNTNTGMTVNTDAPWISSYLTRTFTPVVTPTPEPASLTFFGIGGVGLALRRRFQKNA